MSFNFAQTFYVDPETVKGAPEVGISKVDLFFRAKPRRENNKSGIVAPGVEIFIAPCENGVPVISELIVIRPQEPTEHGARFVVKTEVGRKEWDEIQCSLDATVPTTFKFESPINLKTGFEYALVAKFDGNEDFVVWYSRKGDNLLGSSTISSGPSGQYIGNFYSYISPTNANPDPTGTGLAYSEFAIEAGNVDSPAIVFGDTSYSAGSTNPEQGYLLGSWRPDSDIDVKFTIYCARYSHNGYPVAANTSIVDDPTSEVRKALLPPVVVSNNIITMYCPALPQEYIRFNRLYSNPRNIVHGDMVYQRAPLFPGGTTTPLTISVGANQTNVVANGSYLYANGDTFHAANGFYSVFPPTSDDNWIVVQSANTVQIRKVVDVLNTNTCVVEEAFTISNTTATFMKSAVGRLISMSQRFMSGSLEDFIHLSGTNANSTVRFVNNTIESVSVTANGTGYSNTDYLVISGYENISGVVTGGYSAYANIVTNGSGNIVSIQMANHGCGFVNTAWLSGTNVQVTNSTGGAVPSGTANGATFSYVVGQTLFSEFNNGNSYFSNCDVINLSTHVMKPEITVNNPLGTAYTIKHRLMHYEQNHANAYGGKAYFANASPNTQNQTVKIFKNHYFKGIESPVIVSRSNEYVIPYSNGSAVPESTLGAIYSNTNMYIFEYSSNNDFTQLFVEPEVIHSHFEKYIINNDYTNEHTNYGAAHAKAVMTKVNLANDRFAEDLVVYLTAYRPRGTDFKIYARIHNSADPEAFDDKDWTLLQQEDGIGVYSSQVDDTDYIELTYSFQQWPNNTILDGTVETTNAYSNVVGNGTDFATDLAANDIVKVYSPLFPNNYIIDVVTSVTNSSLITLANPIINNNLLGSGFKVAKVDYANQAFNYYFDDNVVRYYNSNNALFTKFDTFQIKVVMLSNNENYIPRIDDIRGIAVSS